MATEGQVETSAGGGFGSKSKSLFIWTPNYFDKNFQARFFCNRVVDHLVDAGLGLNDFWYDSKERLLLSPMRCSSRMRAVESCQAAIIFLLWPSKDGEPTSSSSLLSVTELAELSVLCMRSMPSQSTAAATRSSPLVKLFVICQDDKTMESMKTVLPPSLDFALTTNPAGRSCVVRIPWSPSDVSISISHLREMAGTVSGELVTHGVSDWCRLPTSVPSRAAWLSTASTTQKISTTISATVKHPPLTPASSAGSRNVVTAESGSTYNNNTEAGSDASGPVSKQKSKGWLTVSAPEWTPDMVLDFLISIRVPEVVCMRIEELAIDGQELAIMDADDFSNHVLVTSNEVCRLLHKKIHSSIGIDSLMNANVNSARNSPKSVYLIFDPRDAKLAHQLKRQIETYNFEVHQHGQLGRTRTEFALTQLPKLMKCSFFVVLFTETALASPFVWEEVCLLRSVIQPPASSIVTLSWNTGFHSLEVNNIFPVPNEIPGQNAGSKPNAENGDVNMALPPIILLLADALNIPLIVKKEVASAVQKVAKLVEHTLRPPPPGIVLSTPISHEFDDILAPNSAITDPLMFQPLLSSVGSGGGSLAATSKLSKRLGFFISNFLLPFQEMRSLPLPDDRLLFLSSVYISAPTDVALLCDWADAKIAAVPLLTALRNAGLRCYADFENPLSVSQTTSGASLPKAKIRLLLLTASSGHLRPSHPLLSTAILESPMSPLLFVLCSRSPIISSDEIMASSSYPSTTQLQLNTSTHQPQPLRGYFGDDNNESSSTLNHPSALLLDMSSSRGITRFVNAICRYLGHRKRGD